MVKNNRGWVRIVEAFVAILLIMGASLIMLNQGLTNRDLSSKVYSFQISVLREIQLNDTLREEILIAGEPPILWEDQEFPSDTKEKINERIPDYLNCEGKICEMNDTCVIENGFSEDVYAQSISLLASLETYNPRQLKLFCWEN